MFTLFGFTDRVGLSQFGLYLRMQNENPLLELGVPYL